jgi:hypothetical protein
MKSNPDPFPILSFLPLFTFFAPLHVTQLLFSRFPFPTFSLLVSYRISVSAVVPAFFVPFFTFQLLFIFLSLFPLSFLLSSSPFCSYSFFYLSLFSSFSIDVSDVSAAAPTFFISLCQLPTLPVEDARPPKPRHFSLPRLLRGSALYVCASEAG